MENVIKIEGDPEQVNKAIEELKKIDEYLRELSYAVIPVNQAHYKHIIGKSGANINRLKDDLKINVLFEEGDNGSSIRIEGPKDSVEQAKKELQEKIEKLDNEKTKDVIIDRRMHRSIIGYRGETIRELKEKYAQVTF